MIARVYPITSGALEPYLQVGFASLSLDSEFISRVDEGNAMAVIGLPERPPQPVLRTVWSAGLSVTGVLDFGR